MTIHNNSESFQEHVIEIENITHTSDFVCDNMPDYGFTEHVLEIQGRIELDIQLIQHYLARDNGSDDEFVECELD